MPTTRSGRPTSSSSGRSATSSTGSRIRRSIPTRSAPRCTTSRPRTRSRTATAPACSCAVCTIASSTSSSALPTAEDRASIEELAAPLLAHRIEPIPDVEATLVELGRRHDLLLLTKGDEREQQTKIDVSGFGEHFRRIVIVPEKNTEVYVQLVEVEQLDPARTWMIGNSPKSDIGPALAAGLGAVFIPNVNTWAMEHDEVDETAERLLQIERFSDLLADF